MHNPLLLDILDTMRKIILIMSIVLAFTMNAQFNAYQYGQDVVNRIYEQQQAANQQAYNYGKATALYIGGQKDVYDGNFEAAIDKFSECTFYDYVPALLALGQMNELGLGTTRDTDYALRCYQAGAAKGNVACKQSIERIRRDGFFSAAYKDTWLANYRAVYAAQYSGAGSYSTPSAGGDDIDVDHSCRACNNTGVCNGCRGTGISYGTTRCNMCYGSGKCMNCGGKGWH